MKKNVFIIALSILLLIFAFSLYAVISKYLELVNRGISSERVLNVLGINYWIFIFQFVVIIGLIIFYFKTKEG